MSVLSERDIIEELGSNILIYPFQRENLLGCCLWLTSSEYAYSIKTENLLLINTDQILQKQYFNIPSRDTALVWTNESVSLSEYFCGSVHSKVTLVTKGLGHIGTKVNPNWSGILAIAIHNLSDKEIRIDVGETIAYLRFYRLNSKSDSPPDLDSSARLDILPNSPPTALVNWINDRQNLWRKGSRENLQKKLISSATYKAAKDAISQGSLRYQIYVLLRRWAPVLAVSILIFIYLLLNQKNNFEELIVAIIPIIYAVVSELTKSSKSSP